MKDINLTLKQEDNLRAILKRIAENQFDNYNEEAQELLEVLKWTN